MADVCDFTDLPVDQCAHCLGHRPAPDKVERVLGQVIDAEYAGVCAHCDERFPAGTPIALAITEPGLEARWCIATHTFGGAAA